MAQPALRPASSRSRLASRNGSGLPHSRSGERIHHHLHHNGGEGSSSQSASSSSFNSNVLRNKVSRTHMSSNTAPTAIAAGKAAVLGGERRRPALGDKTNMQNASQSAAANDHGFHKGAAVDNVLKHKIPTTSSIHPSAVAVRRDIGGKPRPVSAIGVATSSKPNAAESTLTTSKSFAGGRHLRGASSSSGTTLTRHTATAIDKAPSSSVASTSSSLTVGARAACQASSLRQTSQQSMRSSNVDDDVMTAAEGQEQAHAARPRAQYLHARAASSATSADDDMSEAGSDWQSSSVEGIVSSRTETEDEEAVRASRASAVASSDEELIELADEDDVEEGEEEDDEDASDAESVLLSNLDPDCLVSLPLEIDELARDKAAQISEQYEETVLRPAMVRLAQERQEAVGRGELTADLAAHDDELALMGLDPDEVRDTSMVAEYSKEIFEYMSKCECRTMANPNYMDFQGEIRWHMRATLVDWLMQVHMRYHMMPETLWIAINVVDRFLSARVVSLAKLQLVGVTAMFIAAKYEEILAPSVDEFVFMTENGYTREEILKGERIILSTLDFNISSYCSPYSWVRRISKADDYDIQTRTLAKFLMELTLYDHRFLRAKPSLIAAIAMYLSKKMLGGSWNEAFVYYSRSVEEQLAPGANLLLERLVDDTFLDCFVCRKYGNRRFLRASNFAREWALRNQERMLVASTSASSNISAIVMGGVEQELSDMQADLTPIAQQHSAPAAAAVY